MVRHAPAAIALTLAALAPAAARAEPRLVNLTDAPVTVTLNCAEGARVVHLEHGRVLSLACAGAGAWRPVTLAAQDPRKSGPARHMLAHDALYLVDQDSSGAIDVREYGHGFEPSEPSKPTFAQASG